MQLTFDGTGQRSDYLADIGVTARRQRNTADAYAHKPVDNSSARIKTGGPMKEPPKVPPLDRNPRKHHVVCWRHDGRLETQVCETKESALEYGKSLTWVIYYQYMVMDGRDMVEKHSIDIPDGFALDDNGIPYRVAP